MISVKHRIGKPHSAIADQIADAALSVQHRASDDITKEELLQFYTTFEKLRDRLIAIATNIDKEDSAYEQ